MSALLAALLTGLAVLVLLPRTEAAARERLGRLETGWSAADGGTTPRDRSRGVRGPEVAAAGAGAAVFLVLGGAAGVTAGVLTAVVLSRWLAGLEPRAVRRRREQIEADLPSVADLLAACLLAGCPPVDAVAAVGAAVDGPFAAELREVSANLRLGADPAGSWLRLADGQPALAPLARCWARALQTGAPLADAMIQLADEQRVIRRWAVDAEARRAGVRAAAPLGLCFLPAFVLIGVIPAIAGIAATVLG